jgi:hypothetical protein
MGYTTEEFEFDSHFDEQILLYRIQIGILSNGYQGIVLCG